MGQRPQPGSRIRLSVTISQRHVGESRRYRRPLVDTSALVRLLRDPVVRGRWEQQVAAGLVAICPLTELEFLYSARSAADRAWLAGQLCVAYGWVVTPPGTLA